MTKIIDCKSLSHRLRQTLKDEIKDWKFIPGLAVIIVGDDPASKIYVRNKEAACAEIGIRSEIYRLPVSSTTEDVKALIKSLNGRYSIDGILVQLPLPSHIDSKAVIGSIADYKDVDALSNINIGKLVLGNQKIAPCTPTGIIDILDDQKIDVGGKHCVIVGRSSIVGKPMACLMLQKNATVTVCHSHTKNLSEICKQADILIVSVGIANFITKDMIKDGAVVIDVGINRNPDGKLVGDVLFNDALKKASYITPVPGGVGVMTVTELLRNTIELAKERRY